MADWLAARAHAPESAPKGQRKLADLKRYASSVKHWLSFFEADRATGAVRAAHTVADVGHPQFFARFVSWREQHAGRRGRRVSPHTISRDLAALRQALNWAWKIGKRIPSAPFIPDVGWKPPGREVALLPAQLAALLDAARRVPERGHVLRYILIVLGTSFRSQAVLASDKSWVAGGVFDSGAGRRQTSKRRGYCPVVPTLAPWLDEIKAGRLVQYRVPIAEKRWKHPKVPEYFERPTKDIGRAFAECMVEAGLVGEDGQPLGSPNVLRHTVLTWHDARGVPEIQIDTASGHAARGTRRRNYVHLRAEHFAEWTASVEALFAEIGQHTDAHLRYHRDTNVIDLSARRAAGGGENG